MHCPSVILPAPTGAGSWNPSYLVDSKLINVERKNQRKFRYQVNVDSVLIFDLDLNGIVMAFELIIRRDRWKIREPFPSRPLTSRKADLGFTKESIARKFYDLSAPGIVVETNQLKTSVRFFLCLESSRPEPIELSQRCIAFVEDGQLVGFHLDLIQ